MKAWLKEYVLPYVPLATLGLLLLGFYSGIRADLREMSGRIDAVNGRIDAVNETLSDVRERLAVIETRIRMEDPPSVEQAVPGKPAKVWISAPDRGKTLVDRAERNLAGILLSAFGSGFKIAREGDLIEYFRVMSEMVGFVWTVARAS